jgi:hypothetical protein
MKNISITGLKGLLIIALFAISMGYLESAVVVYLRQIYYPAGFAFPLKNMDLHIAMTEIFREAATLIMLVSIGIIAGRTWLGKFGVFIFAFGIWDIFYYIFLKLLLDWPESLLTWDILFLLPSTWVGPVLAPVINAVSMVIFGGMIWHFESKNRLITVRLLEWILLIIGSVMIVWSYMEDYLKYLHREFSWAEIFSPKNTDRLMDYATKYIPVDFNWVVFCIGQGMIMGTIWLYYNRNRMKDKI